MQIALALLAGIVFGIGLAVAGMTNPQKVLNFLDVWSMRAGRWDPTLLMVFVGALPVMFVAYRVRAKRPYPWQSDRWLVPSGDLLDGRLLIGSALFGIGWGLVGLCPGPAVASLPLLSRPMLGPGLVFLGAMMAGVWIASITRQSGTRSATPAI